MAVTGLYLTSDQIFRRIAVDPLAGIAVIGHESLCTVIYRHKSLNVLNARLTYSDIRHVSVGFS